MTKDEFINQLHSEIEQECIIKGRYTLTNTGRLTATEFYTIVQKYLTEISMVSDHNWIDYWDWYTEASVNLEEQ